MSETALVTFGDIKFRAIGQVGWTFSAGTTPSQTLIEITDDLIPAFQGIIGQPKKLTIAAHGHPKIEVDGIYAIDVRAGSKPYLAVVRLSDVRWLWQKQMILASYNIPRRSGDKRVISFTSIENIKLADDRVYNAWSLNNGKPWTAQEIIADIIGKTDNAFKFDLGDLKLTDSVPQSIRITATVDRALDIAMGGMSAVSVTVDTDGMVVFYSTLNQRDLAFLDPVKDLTLDGCIRMMDRSKLRPSKVNVYFAREIELRFDYLTNNGTATVERDDPQDPPILENVIQQPETQLLYKDGKTRTQGTWVNIQDYLLAIAGAEYDMIGQAQGPLNDAKIRANYMGLWYAVERDYTHTKLGGVDQLWVSRLAAIRDHYRKTFRLTPKWRDRISSLRAYLVSLIDPETGARGPSPVFTNYITKPSGFAISQSGGTEGLNNSDVGRQVFGWNRVLSKASIAPAEVRVIDPDAGVFTFAFKADPWREAEDRAPGSVKALPKFRVTGKFPTPDQVSEANVLWTTVGLIPEFQAAFILSVIQAAPNSTSRYHKIEVTPEAAGLTSGIFNIGKCEGPELDLFVPEYEQTCRVAWLDDQSSIILGAFWDNKDSVEIPDSLIVNEDIIKSLAEAYAAQNYVALMDRPDGKAVFPIEPKLVVNGCVQFVSHAINTNGTATTTVTISNEHSYLPKEAFVPEGIQAIVRGLVQP